MVFKWCIRSIIFLMLCTIITLSYFLAVFNPKCSDLKKEYDILTDKYKYTVDDLLFGKNEMSEKQTHISSLYQIQ